MEQNEKVMQDQLFEETQPLASEPRKSRRGGYHGGHRRKTLPEGARRHSIWSTDMELLYLKEFLIVYRDPTKWGDYMTNGSDFLKTLSDNVGKREAIKKGEMSMS